MKQFSAMPTWRLPACSHYKSELANTPGEALMLSGKREACTRATGGTAETTLALVIQRQALFASLLGSTEALRRTSALEEVFQ